MKKSVLCIAALMLIAGAGAGVWAKSYTVGMEYANHAANAANIKIISRNTENSEIPNHETASILTPANDEQLASSEEGMMIIADDDVPLAAGPGGMGLNTDIASEYMQPASQENPYIRQVMALVNEERVKAGLSPLEISDEVSLAAGIRAEELISTFSHTRPDGTSYRTALEQRGISYRGCGENVAYGYSTPEAVMSAWMDSEGHRSNILNEGFTNIGVGYVKDNRGLGYWTQIFTIQR